MVTYAFLHGSFEHLFFNMLGLWMFGSELEHVWGQRRYLQFYFASVLAAALTQLVVNALLGSQAADGRRVRRPVRPAPRLRDAVPEPHHPALLRDPDEGEVPRRSCSGSSSCTRASTVLNSGVAHFAHLGGMLGGLADDPLLARPAAVSVADDRPAVAE